MTIVVLQPVMMMLYYWKLLYLSEKVLTLVTIFSLSEPLFSRRVSVQTVYALRNLDVQGQPITPPIAKTVLRRLHYVPSRL